MKTAELKSKIITQLRFHRISGKGEDLTANHLIEIIEEYRSQHEEFPSDEDLEGWLMNDCGGASPESAQIRDDMRRGAKWMRSIASPLLASRDARIRELEESNRILKLRLEDSETKAPDSFE